MLGNTFEFFIITFLMLEISADDDVDVKGMISAEEEQAKINNNQPSLNSNFKKIREEDADMVDINEQNHATVDDENTEEILERFKDENHPRHVLKMHPTKIREPGFDLSPEEMEKFKIWKNGVIPYYIDVVSFSDKVLRDKIRNYLQMVNSAAGLNFVELVGPPSDENERWVFFVNRRGLLRCADHSVRNFTTRGVQKVVLGYDCIATRGETPEAVMSIVGVPAQHNAPDRDKYIQVYMENIMPEKRYLFEKLSDKEWLFHDLDYDFKSITHYDIFEHSADGHPTIQPKDESVDLGLAKELSSQDLLKIKMLYSYISRNKILQTQQCKKLIKPRSKLDRFILHQTHIEPRDKPSKYLGSSKERLKFSFPLRNESEDTREELKHKKKKEDILNHGPIHKTKKNKHQYRENKSPIMNRIKKKVLQYLSDYVSSET